jgi:hypothetical protein
LTLEAKSGGSTEGVFPAVHIVKTKMNPATQIRSYFVFAARRGPHRDVMMRGCLPEV